MLLSACGSPQAARDLDQAMDLYGRGSYAEALTEAEAAAASGQGTVKDQANYIAGLSAYRLGELDRAEQALNQAARSTNRETAGSAYAMLGTLRYESRRYSEAAEAFRSASELLSGEEAAEAARQATAASDAAHGKPPANLPHGMRRATADSATGTWTIQLGAFRDRSNADSAANDVRGTASKHGLGQVSVVPTRDAAGKPVYAVRVGSFATRRAADDARRALGRLDSWVTRED